MKIAVLFFLFLIVLNGCSSSDNGAVLPDETLDSQAPVITKTSPPAFRSTYLPTNSTFQFYFDELVDLDSIDGNVALRSGKARDIFRTANLGSKEFLFLDRDERAVSVSHNEELFTFEREEGVSVVINIDGLEEITTRTVVEEGLRSVLAVSPVGRLALWSQYSLVIEKGLKDRSNISSFSPLDGLETTGNFISPAVYDFGTEDGTWQPGVEVNDAYLIDGYNIGAHDYISSDSAGVIFWVQQKSGINAFSQLFSRPFDQESQAFSGLGERFDYNPTIDGPVSNSSEVTSFSADTFADQHCVTWVYSESTSVQTVYLRCANGSEHYPRLELVSHPDDKPLAAIELHMVDEHLGFVSYLFDGVLNVYALYFEHNEAPVVLGYQGLGSSDLSILDVARSVRESSSGVELSVVYTTEDVSAAANERFSVVNARFSITQDRSLTHLVDTIERGELSYQGISVGFDYLGTGIVGWTKGIGNNRGFYTATFGGAGWNSPVAVQKNGLGPITGGTVFVFRDGQVLFAWVQEVLGKYQVKVQGLFPGSSDLGDAGIVRPNVLEVFEGSSPIGDLQILGDREGNAVLMYTTNGSISFARFRQNIEWDSAWGSASGLTNYYGGGITLTTVLEDGRLALVTKDSRSAHDAVVLRLFTDF